MKLLKSVPLLWTTIVLLAIACGALLVQNRNQATSIRQFAKDKVKVEKKLVVLDSLIKQNNQNLYKVLDAAIVAKMEAADAKEKLKNQLKK